jgi:hypothetical protein
MAEVLCGSNNLRISTGNLSMHVFILIFGVIVYIFK